MNLTDVVKTAIEPALAILPSAMDTREARVMLLAIGLQESRFMLRRQVGGPARGFWQFEEGTKMSRGGVWGVYLHDSSRYWLDRLSTARRQWLAAHTTLTPACSALSVKPPMPANKSIAVSTTSAPRDIKPPGRQAERQLRIGNGKQGHAE
nr:hypothetical protein [Ralstonia mannitolilytica]